MDKDGDRAQRCESQPRDGQDNPIDHDDARDRGVSLVEIMIVLVIIGLVATIAVPQLLGYLDRSKVDTAQIQVRSLSSVLDLYRLDVGTYPTSEQGLLALMEQPSGVSNWHGPYLKLDVSLTDPWGNAYAYDVSDNGRAVSVMSLGADGTPGGEGLDADIAG